MKKLSNQNLRQVFVGAFCLLFFAACNSGTEPTTTTETKVQEDTLQQVMPQLDSAAMRGDTTRSDTADTRPTKPGQ